MKRRTWFLALRFLAVDSSLGFRNAYNLAVLQASGEKLRSNVSVDVDSNTGLDQSASKGNR